VHDIFEDGDKPSERDQVIAFFDSECRKFLLQVFQAGKSDYHHENPLKFDQAPFKMTHFQKQMWKKLKTSVFSTSDLHRRYKKSATASGVKSAAGGTF